MIGILIILICIAIGVYVARDNDIEEKAWGGVIGAFGGIVILFFLSMIVSVACGKITEWKEDYKVEIASTNIRDSISGRFSLGSGYIQSQPYYFVNQKLSETSYKPINIACGNVDAIIEDSSVSPHIVVYKRQRINNKLKSIIPFVDEVQYEYYKYSFVIPKGSLIQEFKVN